MKYIIANYDLLSLKNKRTDPLPVNGNGKGSNTKGMIDFKFYKQGRMIMIKINSDNFFEISNS